MAAGRGGGEADPRGIQPEGDVLVDRNGTSRRIEAGTSPVLNESGRRMGPFSYSGT